MQLNYGDAFGGKYWKKLKPCSVSLTHCDIPIASKGKHKKSVTNVTQNMSKTAKNLTQKPNMTPKPKGVTPKSKSVTPKSKSVTKSGQYKFKCQDCKLDFKSYDQLEAHWIKVHIDPVNDAKPRVHTCDICDQKFDQQQKVLKHMRVHFGGDTKVTSQEQKRPRKQTLKSRNVTYDTNLDTFDTINVSDGEGPPKKVINLGHSESSKFLSQVSQSSPMNMLQCDYCTKKLKGRKAINKHILTHFPTILKPNQCPDCEHVFDSEWDLKYHQRLMKEN